MGSLGPTATKVMSIPFETAIAIAVQGYTTVLGPPKLEMCAWRDRTVSYWLHQPPPICLLLISIISQCGQSELTKVWYDRLAKSTKISMSYEHWMKLTQIPCIAVIDLPILGMVNQPSVHRFKEPP